MAILRFPNPGSDINKFISTFSTMYRALENTANFTHDDARDALIADGLVSSSGAIGLEAVRRSVRDDRSRDPLYNQVKMYSELYRMLGWLKPGTQNTNFNFTELSSYVADYPPELQRRLFEECLLSIVFPNPLVESKGGNIIRPFAFILKMASKLDNVIFRDEIIITTLNTSSDLIGNALEDAIDMVSALRGKAKDLLDRKAKLSVLTKIQQNTLENYTRFPLGSMKATGWFDSESVRGIYDKPLNGYILLPFGKEKVNQLSKMVDVRRESLAEFDLETRGAFTLLAHYAFLERCGFDITAVNETLPVMWDSASPILKHFGISNRQDIFYSPIQQGTTEEIDYANKLDEKLNP